MIVQVYSWADTWRIISIYLEMNHFNLSFETEQLLVMNNNNNKIMDQENRMRLNWKFLECNEENAIHIGASIIDIK